MGFTLRDLLMKLDPQYAQQWREKEAKKFQKYKDLPRLKDGSMDWEEWKADPYAGQWHDGNMLEGQGLRELIKQKRHEMYNSKQMPSPPRPMSLQDYYDEMITGHDRAKAPPRKYGYY